MRLSPLLPTRLRVDLYRVASTLRHLREGRPARPVFASRHTRDELEQRLARAVEAREAMRFASDDVGVAPLVVRDVRRTTPDAATIIFDRPDGDRWAFRPGQHLTLRVEVDGVILRRPYSLCSDPADPDALAVTVKRVPGGRASTWLVDHVAPGDVIDVLGPHGRFGTAPDPDRARHVVLVAGGSGITPLLSIARALLRGEPASTVDLVYANRGYRSIILRDDLLALAAQHDRLRITWVLERASKRLDAHLGRLEGEVLATALPCDERAEYYVCGPAPMMDAVCGALDGAGVPADAVHVERFTSATRASEPATGAVWSVTFARSGKLVQIDDDRTLLDAASAAGVALPYSCTMGGCGACAQTVVSGDVAVDEPNCLTDAERKAGVVLCCVGRPRGPVVLDA